MIAKKSSLVILPDGATDAGAIVAQAMAIVQKISKTSSEEMPTTSKAAKDAVGPWDTPE